MVPTREIYWNIVGGALIYVFLAASAAALAYGVWSRWRLWQLGTAQNRLDRIPERIKGLLVDVFGHRRQLREPFTGVAHLLVFYGFLAQLIATSLVSIQEWTGIHYLQGNFYLGFSLLSDSFGLLGIVGICMLLWRRYVMRPPHLHTVMDDGIALGLLLLLFVQGFVTEGLRIAATELQQQPDLAPWSPGGYAVALMVQGLGDESLRSIHRFSWWFHAVTAFAFIGYFAYGKFKHIVFGLANIFLRSLDSTGKLEYPDIDKLAEEDPDALEVLGVERIQQLTWKSLLDVDACVNCGRCESVCPATGSGVPLSPRKLIQDMHHHLSAVGPSLLQGSDGSEPLGEASASESQGPLRLFGDGQDDGPMPSVLEEELWGCRTCGACMEECPVYVEHIPKIVDMRRYLVMTESKMSDEAQLFLKNMDDRMHPWTGAPHDREEWYQDLDVKVLGNGDTAEYLFWVGCTGSMIDRNIEVTRSMVKLLKAADVDFAILGAEEVCTGDPARRAGGELTFQICAKTNIEVLANYGVEKIITTCPHCFNTYRNEYPDFGGKYEVVRHTELIRDLIAEGRLKIGKKLDSLTYHDPCYLGRHNGVYDAPREVLGELASSGGFSELERNRSSSLCCGSGGGYAWMDDNPSKRINKERMEDIKACKAETTAVSCPFCLQMLEDAMGAENPDGKLRMADIAELVAEALEE